MTVSKSFSADEILEARSPNPLEIPVIDSQKIVVVQDGTVYFLLVAGLNSIIINKRNN